MITAAAAAVVVCGAPAANASSIATVSHRPALAAGGAWGAAAVVPGTAALNADGLAQVNAVSCTSAGNCGAGGY
jgi:hypothetical protein